MSSVSVSTINPEIKEDANPLGYELWDFTNGDLNPNAVNSLLELYNGFDKRGRYDEIPVHEPIQLDSGKPVYEQVLDNRRERDRLLKEKHNLAIEKMQEFFKRQRSLESSWALSYPRALMDLAITDRDVFEYIVLTLEEVNQGGLNNLALRDLFLYLAEGIDDRLDPNMFDDNFTGTPWQRVLRNVAELNMRFN